VVEDAASSMAKLPDWPPTSAAPGVSTAEVTIAS